MIKIVRTNGGILLFNVKKLLIVKKKTKILCMHSFYFYI